MFLVRRALTAGAAAALAGLALAPPAGAQPTDQDTSWMVAAHQSNLAEIAAGTAAVEQATTDDVRGLGQMFIDMHTQLDGDLTAAAGQLGVELPAEPTEEQQAQLADVAAQGGAAFDTAWVASQTAGHATTLAATDTEIEAGSDATVIGLAEAARPVVADHLASLEALGGTNGTPASVDGGTGGQAAGTDATGTGMAIAAAGAAVLAGGAVVRVRSVRAAAARRPASRSV